MNATQRQKADFAAAKALVMKAYGLSEEAYSNNIFNGGCAFLEGLFNDSEAEQAALRGLRADKAFWRWWVFQWQRDDLALSGSSLIYTTPYAELKQTVCFDRAWLQAGAQKMIAILKNKKHESLLK